MRKGISAAGRAENRRGFTLVEVMVSMTILLIAIGGVYAALLTAVTNTGGNEQRYQANLASRQLAETLKIYQTADHLTAIPSAPGSPPWHLPGDTCGSCAGGASCWALEACTHDATQQLHPALQAAGVTMTYTVENSPSPGGDPLTLPHVTINVNTP
jgi:prepilin-type N-terminal cleavage/methylation domain-containing protein